MSLQSLPDLHGLTPEGNANGMDATQALRDAENALRDFIAERLEAILGSTWEGQLGINPEKVEKWRGRRETERIKWKGTAIDERLLYYSDFYDIAAILRKHWDHFKDALLDLKEIDLWLSKLEQYRDADAHRRELFPHQKHLVLGASGEIRARLVRYRSKMDDIDSHFPRIEAIRESLGRTWTPANHLFRADIPTVRVGDSVEFVVTAIDPLGEPLDHGHIMMPIGRHTWGLPNCFSYTFRAEDIGKRREFAVVIRSRRPYHANAGNDGMVVFCYHVLPSQRIAPR